MTTDVIKLQAKRRRTALILSLIALLLLIGLFVLGFLFLSGGEGGGKDEFSAISHPYLYDNNRGEITVVTDTKRLTFKGFFGALHPSIDGTRGYITLLPETGNTSYGHEIYDLSGQRIAENAAPTLSVSENGEGLCYHTADADGKRILCYVYRDTVTEIGGEHATGAVLSPDGRTVVYYNLTDGSPDELLLWQDGKQAVLGQGFVPLGVSDNGTLIYGFNMNEQILVYQDGVLKERPEADFMGIDGPYYNADHTECIFLEGADYYLMKNGEVLCPLPGELMLSELLLPGRSTHMLGHPDGTVSVATDSFLGMFYRREDGLYYLSETGEAHLVTDTGGKSALMPDGKTVVLRVNADIYSINGTVKEPSYRLQARNTADLLGCGRNGIFYVGQDGKLLYTTLRGRTTIVAPAFSKASTVVFGQYLYYQKDAKLHRSDGGPGELLEGMDCKEDVIFEQLPGALVIRTYNDGIGTVSLSRDGITFETVAEEAG